MVWPFSSSGSKDSLDSTNESTPHRSSERKSSIIPSTSTSNAPIKTSIPPPQPAKAPKDKPLLLEDTEPRFFNGSTPSAVPIKEAVDSISTEDFKFTNLVKMPCFREAGLTGLSALGVLGGIIFLTQKSPTKAVNWGIGGFLLGSTVSWEQCRSKRRKEFAFAAKAKETVALKEKPMMNNPNEKLSQLQEKSRDEVKSWWSRS